MGPGIGASIFILENVWWLVTFAAAATYCLLKPLPRATLHILQSIERPMIICANKAIPIFIEDWKTMKEKIEKKGIELIVAWNSLTAPHSSMAYCRASPFRFDLVRQLYLRSPWVASNARNDVGQCAPDNRLHRIIQNSYGSLRRSVQWHTASPSICEYFKLCAIYSNSIEYLSTYSRIWNISPFTMHPLER